MDQLVAGGELNCSLLVVINDDWQPQSHQQLNRYSLQYHLPWLRVGVEAGRGIIGPCTLPWESGCATCADNRRLAAMGDATELLALQAQSHHAMKGQEYSWLTAFHRDLLAHIVVEEVRAFSRRPASTRTYNALILLQGESLHTTIHPFLPDPLCPDCAHLPEDSAEAALQPLQAQQKLAPFTYRIRQLADDLEGLHKRYVDEQTGMIHRVTRDRGHFYANVAASIGLYRGKEKESGFGRALSYGASQGAAIAEALERYAGIQPTGKETVVRASYRQLGEQALEPTTLGLHSVEQYAMPDYPYVPYHHDLVCNWVWGYSFRSQRPILVPEHYAYYGTQNNPDRPFVYEISNGCALGSCLEEAILYGILEVAERDAFLLTWYARLSMPRIDPLSATDCTIALLIERIEYLTGYTIHAFNITMEQRVPCFWVMAVDELQRPGYPRALCAAGSHLHPEKALANALSELAPLLEARQKSYPPERERALNMLANSFAVQQMDDHALLYALPEAFERLDFLDQTRQQQTFTEAFSDFYTQNSSLDLTADLKDLLARYLRTGLDIIVVDQTTPEQYGGGFRCVKVMIPGMLPMTFGHAMRRVTGLQRLSSRLSTNGEVNPYPHPFP